MFINPQQGKIDGLHWFAGQDQGNPSFLHITLHDENGRNTYYDFREFDGNQIRLNMEEVIEEYREWLNSTRLPRKT